MTVIRRDINSIPVRSATETWNCIIELLTEDIGTSQHLKSVSGIVATAIGSEATSEAPIVIYGSGPRVRVYTVFGEDAIEEEKKNEATIAFDISEGDWSISIPCLDEDLDWIQDALKRKTDSIRARSYLDGFETEESSNDTTKSNTKVNFDSFFKS